MRRFLAVAAALHAAFMFAELFRWSNPLLLQTLSAAKIPDHPFDGCQMDFVVAIVHNAAIYNGIVAGGLFWAASGRASLDVARVMLIGAVVAGAFGFATLSWVPGIQAGVGIIGLILLRRSAEK